MLFSFLHQSILRCVKRDPIRWSRNYFYLQLKNNSSDSISFSQLHFTRDYIISSYFHSRHKLIPLRGSVDALNCILWMCPILGWPCHQLSLPCGNREMPECLVCWKFQPLTSDGHLILFQSYTTVTESFRRFLKSPQALLLPTDEPNSHIPDKVKCVLKHASKFWYLHLKFLFIFRHMIPHYILTQKSKWRN